MTITDLMQQDPREFFGFDDPRAIQEVLADDDAEREPSPFGIDFEVDALDKLISEAFPATRSKKL